jgi:predicted metal-dependent hydrolase
MMVNLPIEVIRSFRRKKTISARLERGKLLIYLPARLSNREEKEWILKMKNRVENRYRNVPKSDEELSRKAEKLNKKYFDGNIKPNSIVYSDNQKRRFGSCTSTLGTIRISRRLSEMPEWVLDYVIIHELAHLQHPNHSKSFWNLVNRHRLAERARGFLMAKGYEEDSDV